jgi:hypothetical protein
MWRDIKKGDKTAATAKKELALKYATLADTKDKATLDSKDKTYKKYTIDADGKVSTSDVTSSGTEGERVNEILENRSMLFTSGAYKKIPLPQLKEILREYETAAHELMKPNILGKMQFRSGKVSPVEALEKALEVYPKDEEIQEALARAIKNAPTNKRQDKADIQMGTFDGYISNSRDMLLALERVPAASANWLGSATSWLTGALDPLWDKTASKTGFLGEDTTTESITKTGNSTIDKAFGAETVQGNTELYTLVMGLAKQRLMSVYNETGRSISDKDMEREINSIAKGFGGIATKAKMRAALNAAQKQDVNSIYASYRSAYKTENTTDLKRQFLKEMQPANRKYVAGIMGWNSYLDADERPAPVATKPAPAQVSKHLSGVYTEMKRLSGIHGKDNMAIGADVIKYMKSKNMSEDEIAAIFQIINK